MKEILLKLNSIRERVKLLQIEQKPRRPKSILSDKKNKRKYKKERKLQKLSCLINQDQEKEIEKNEVDIEEDLEEDIEENICQPPEKGKNIKEIKSEQPIKLPKISLINFESNPFFPMVYPHSTSNDSAFLQYSQMLPNVFPAFSNSAMPAFNHCGNINRSVENYSNSNISKNVFFEEHSISFGDIAKKISSDFMRRNSNMYTCFKGNQG